MSEWIDWGGGACPVPNGTVVDVRFRDGLEYMGEVAGERPRGAMPGSKAHTSYWRHHGIAADIVAYRVGMN